MDKQGRAEWGIHRSFAACRNTVGYGLPHLGGLYKSYAAQDT